MRPVRKMVMLLQVLAILSFSCFSVRIVDGQQQLCFDNGNYTAGDSFQYYLNNLLGSIATTNSSTLNDDGLFNASTSIPHTSDVVEVMGYCRGDQTPDACRTCLNIAALEIRQMCPRYKQAVLFRDECTLKYSNGSMYGVVSDTLYWFWNCSSPATSWDVFKDVLKQLLQELGTQAASGGLRKYAQGNSSVDLSTLYADVMCSPDLSYQQCTDCLVAVIGDLMPGCIQGYARVPSCQVAYNNSRFFNLIPPVATPSPTSPPPPPPPPGLIESPTPVTKSSSKVWIAVGVSAPSVVLIGVVAIFLALKWKRNPKQSHDSSKPDEDEIVLESLRYNLDTIVDATGNFSEANKLGQGGFGSVFLGTLPNGQQIAVKQLSEDSGQGQTEFKNEVVLLARLQHKNLVRLLGFCLEGSERLLVYEFLPNLSLDRFIFDPLKRGSLRWDIRHKIITGIAQGLLYLHEESGHRIVHRDLKASNILLDGDMNPRLSDFGMARLFKVDQTQANTSRIVGTQGYMAPEYILHGQFSTKSDVFSFGVLVLETVSGRRNLDFQVGEHREVLISRVWRNWCEGKISSIVDPLVKTGYTLDIVRCIHIGLLCVQEDLAIRPTMASIIHMLTRHSTTLPVPKQPAFLTSSQNLPEPGNASDTLRRGNTETSTGSFLSSELSHTKPNPR